MKVLFCLFKLYHFVFLIYHLYKFSVCIELLLSAGFVIQLHSNKESSRIILLKSRNMSKSEWEEARCSVCMDHPHNCILLICTSYGNGCRPYMCGTSYQHSNCFEQFLKASNETETEAAVSNPRVHGTHVSTFSNEDKEKAKPKLKCPLCRGHIMRWDVVNAARWFMNSKLRSCSFESCDYSGTYYDLRKHVMAKHPNARASEVDPERERRWRRLERQRDLGDLASFMRTSFWWLTKLLCISVMRPEPRNSRRRSGSSSLPGTSRAS